MKTAEKTWDSVGTVHASKKKSVSFPLRPFFSTDQLHETSICVLCDKRTAVEIAAEPIDNIRSVSSSGRPAEHQQRNQAVSL